MENLSTTITVVDQMAKDGLTHLKVTLSLDHHRSIAVTTYSNGAQKNRYYLGTADCDPACILMPVESPKMPKGTCSIGDLGFLPETVAKITPVIADALRTLTALAQDLKRWDDDELERNVPGIHEAIRLKRACEEEDDRCHREFEAMMDDEYNDGARPPRPHKGYPKAALDAHLASHPRAAVYLKAKRQDERAHWADNSGAGAAGREAMSILASGGDLEAAEAALAVRRPFND